MMQEKKPDLTQSLTSLLTAQPDEIERLIDDLEQEIEQRRSMVTMLKKLLPEDAAVNRALGGSKGLPKKLKEQVRSLVEEGKTNEEIAQITGLSMKRVNLSVHHYRVQMEGK